jgi:phosphate transport system protein
MSIRSTFDDQLAEIQQHVVHMGQCVEEMIRNACTAIVNSDVELAKQVIEQDDVVDRLEEQTVNLVIRVLMRQAPVATDLRWLTATFGVVSEIEQAADDVVKLSRRLIKMSGQFPIELKVDLSELGELTRLCFGRALKLCVEYSDELAETIIDADQEIDVRYKNARTKLTEMVQLRPDRTRDFIRVIASFHALEHIADHAVEIAKRLKVHMSDSATHQTPLSTL